MGASGTVLCCRVRRTEARGVRYLGSLHLAGFQDLEVQLGDELTEMVVVSVRFHRRRTCRMLCA